jgi:hypothetical protein
MVRRSLRIPLVIALAMLLQAGQLEAQCACDCDGDGHVTITELIRLVNVALGNVDISACPHNLPCDFATPRCVGIHSILECVNVLLVPRFCARLPTPTAQPSVQTPSPLSTPTYTRTPTLHPPTQAPSPTRTATPNPECAITLSPSSWHFSCGTAERIWEGRIGVTVPKPECCWEVRSPPVQLEPAAGCGSAIVNYSFRANYTGGGGATWITFTDILHSTYSQFIINESRGCTPTMTPTRTRTRTGTPTRTLRPLSRGALLR